MNHPEITLRYGQVIERPAHPILYSLHAVGLPIGIADGNTFETCQFTIEKYFGDEDEDPNVYKVRLIPTEEYRDRFGNESMYVTDLKSMIASGTIKLIN